MADLSDVESALTSQVVGALYPGGISQDSAVGVMCRIYRGWPSPASLNADIAAGVVNVTISPAPEHDEVLVPYLDSGDTMIPSNNITLTVTGSSVSFGGQIANGQLVGLLVDRVPYIYETAASDSPESVAANLAALIRAVRNVTLLGPTVIIPGAAAVVARSVMPASVVRALRRQRREIQVCCWCPTPLLRDSVGSLVDVALSGRAFIELADTSQAYIRYRSTQLYDQSQNSQLFRRDLCYWCEFVMTLGSTAPAMLFADLNVSGSGLYA